MALYEDKPLPVWRGIGLLLFSFLIFYCPWQLASRELYRHEGVYVAEALEMPSGVLPVAIAHGVAIKDGAPFYPWLVNLTWRAGVPMEVALRVWPLLCVAILAVIVFFPTRKAAGTTAGFVAAAMVIGGNLMIEKAVEGSALIPSLPLILAGQLLWFRYGFLKGDWNSAWTVLGIFAAMAFYLTGTMALWFLILPLLFMRRPLSIRNKIKRKGVLLGLAALAIAGVLWAVPYWLMPAQKSGWLFDFDDWGNYWWHLLTFPVDTAFRLLPWSVLAWAPFCVAFQWVAPTPIFGRFLRTIVISLFFFLWLNPATEPRDQLVLVGPLAILTGMNYALVVRRYGNPLRTLMNWLTPLLLLAGAGIIVFFWVPPVSEWIKSFNWERNLQYADIWSYEIQGAILGGILVLASLAVMRMRQKPPIWAYLLLISAGPMIVWWSVAVPYRGQLNEKQQIGEVIRHALPPAADGTLPLVYKHNIANFYSEFYYVGAPVATIGSLAELPETQETIYLLSPDFPQYPQRRWTRLVPPDTSYRGKKLYLLRGDLLSPQDSLQVSE